MTDDITINGKCTAMNAASRTFAIRDLANTENPFNWTEPLDVVMLKNGQARWKEGYYLTVTYNPDTHIVRNVTYWQEGKEEWMKAHPMTKGSRPRNEKAILFQRLFKGAIDLARIDPELCKKPLKDRLGACISAAKENMPEACAAAEVQV